jgi:hypothetical protein
MSKMVVVVGVLCLIVQIEAPWLLRSHVLKTAKAAHEQAMAAFPGLFAERV